MKKISGFQHFLASEKLLAVQNQASVNSHFTKDLYFFKESLEGGCRALRDFNQEISAGRKMGEKIQDT